VAKDFYYALYQLYNGKGCFSEINFSIPPTNPLVIFGESYGGKYAPAIARLITKKKQEEGGFLKGLKGVAIGDGFTFPYEIMSEVGTYAYHLGLLDFQERMRLEKILLNGSRHAILDDYDALHLDFDNAIEYIVKQAGDINVYDIKVDGDYEGTSFLIQKSCSPTSATSPSSRTSTSSIPRWSTTARRIWSTRNSTLTS
jgi:carboxypeptidase C (cathepsin A)